MSAADTNIPRPDGWYPLIIVYRRPMDAADQVIQALGGGEKHCEFTHCELYLPDDGETITIFKGGNMEKSSMLPILYDRRPDRFAWHLIPLNHEEYMRMIQWNTEQVLRHCPYNFRDIALQAIPSGIRNSFVHDLELTTSRSPNRIFCSQAIILALRDASHAEGARQILRDFSLASNSRLTTPSDLARLTTQYLGVGVNKYIVPKTLEEVNAHLHDAVFNPASLFSDPNSCATQATRQLRR
jgi:hypothetical protein